MRVQMAKFHFKDLHGFKDYLVFVQTYSPDRYPPREGAGPDEQWSLDLAFRGLREGLKIAVAEKGPKPVFAECEKLVDEAYDAYRAGLMRDGFFKLEEVISRLRKVPTH
jgi:hypothetical protein